MNDEPSRLDRNLPDTLQPLVRLAWNFWWTWNNGGIALFRDIDPAVWDACGHNPLKQLCETSLERLSQLAVDPDYLSRLDHLAGRFEAYMAGGGGSLPGTSGGSAPPWARQQLPQASADRPVAYFCAEYGIHESLPLYAGGLGILAGDQLKSASDLGVPLVAVGLLYRQGYFRQRIDLQGWQEEFYSDADFSQLPLSLMRGPDGSPLVVQVPVRERLVNVQFWRADVGRVPLYLLDTDRDDNDGIDRWITAHLYGGDANTRIVQEVVLGIGGVRALRALAIDPSVYHLNEGHSAFLTLELSRELVERGSSFADACAEVSRRCVFTTHTPVAAGNDVFEVATVQQVLAHFLPTLGVEVESVFGLGRRHPSDAFEPFGMTPLAIRMSRSTNAVSRRHGEVCARMWQQLWPDRPAEESPIVAVTNGVHHATWVAPLMRRLFDVHLGPDWALRADDPRTWDKLDEIPDAELWRIHSLLRTRLVAIARHRAEIQRKSAGESPEFVERAKGLLDPDVLTIGFARRVAAYKRWGLLVQDVERSLALLNDPLRPVQFVVAGKAHPRDNEAKRILQQLLLVKYRDELQGKVVFMEDYDQYVARKLVQGVDVWLNLPLPPLEASGTSGQKVVVNGGINCSILDGWWMEGSNGRNGWDVGEPFKLPAAEGPIALQDRDEADLESLFALLQNEIAPLFYDRGPDGIPHGWVERMRASIKSLAPAFSATRMVKDYAAIYCGEGDAVPLTTRAEPA